MRVSMIIGRKNNRLITSVRVAIRVTIPRSGDILLSRLVGIFNIDASEAPTTRIKKNINVIICTTLLKEAKYFFIFKIPFVLDFYHIFIR